MKRTVFGAVMLVCLVSCQAFAERVPDWVKGKSKQYTKTGYLSGIGSGETLDAARSSARAEIAKVFSTRIAQYASDESRERSSKKGSKYRLETSGDYRVQTLVSTDEMLDGVEVPETWYSEKKKTYYALAVMDRQKQNSALAAKILDAEVLIARGRNEAKLASSPLKKLKALGGVLSNIAVKEGLIAKKRIIGPAAVADISGPSDRSETEKQMKSEIDNILFAIMTGNDTTGLKSIVGSRVTGLGFKTVDSLPEKLPEGKSFIIIKCGMEIMPVDKKSADWKFYDWAISGMLADASFPDENFAIIQRRGQSSHLTDEAAKNKAITEASDAIALDVENRLNKYFFGKE